MEKRNLNFLSVISLLLIILTLSLGSTCNKATSPSDAIIKFTFHPDCPSVKVKVYINNEYKDLIYTDGSYEYHVKPGTHSYSIRRAGDNKVIWSGQVTVKEGKKQGITLTCSAYG